jgi:RimJ/RimL family protein N-acetyltransferase
MALAFQNMDEGSARAILGWSYEEPYALYNMPPAAHGDALRAFLDPINRYHAISDDHGHLVAYCCFGADARVPGGEYSPDAIDIGMGVRPDLTGQGQGITYVCAVVDFARRTLDPQSFRVTVAEFNSRAMKVWQKAGFEVTQRFERTSDGRAFLVMVRSENALG